MLLHNFIIEEHIKNALKEVTDELDHKDINELPAFKGVSPSSEILCKYIYDKMKERIPQTSKITVWETPTSCACYYEE